MPSDGLRLARSRVRACTGDIEKEIENAERTLKLGDGLTSYTLTQAASRRRAELQQVLDAERQVQSDQVRRTVTAQPKPQRGP